ncbi:hypothetical protein D9611_002533 [Ephemerocybe angulata]|uniref:Vacuolar protein 14 C-terminal Fig4-binding domain-containing protein n=1 Tax=Ephemerocybe angulata TaxID=980116 RepID=A0A8H5FE42_9AGAR|nr:hypothetical protein D9611_002533 [Tulosesus angulatus]
MDTALSRQLTDKIYEKRKAAALEIERQVRECHQQGEQKKIAQMIDQCVEWFNNPANPIHVRNGGLIGLAGTSIALGVDIAPYMDKFIHPLLNCFIDAESRIRYFSAECLYNIAKSSGGEVLVYFNDMFDALSKLAADSELSVKNGAELNDRLLKDLVAEFASVYIPMYPETAKTRNDQDKGVLVDLTDSDGPKKAFSLANFIPMLNERIYVVNPFSRSYLVSWITVLDSVPELELITYLPEFLDGLFKYLSDPTEEVREATKNLLANLVREIHDVTIVSRQFEHHTKDRQRDHLQRHDLENGRDPEADQSSHHGSDLAANNDVTSELDDQDLGTWVPGQGVKIDYPAIIEILLQQLDVEHDEIQQSTALGWLADLVSFAPEVILPFTPRLIPGVLPNLAHHAESIHNAAVKANKLLFSTIQNLPTPQEGVVSPGTSVKGGEKVVPTKFPRSPTPTTSGTPGRQSTLSSHLAKDNASPDLPQDGQGVQRSRSGTVVDSTPRPSQISEMTSPNNDGSRSHSPVASVNSQGAANPSLINSQTQDEPADPFDYQATVNELTVQFISEFEETRVTALKWLIMLHQKVPRKILAMDDGTFPALLKTLSDSSEEVIKHDLQLLAQISSSSEEGYFKAFMMNLLELFSTDRRLLETRGSLIIRQLCVNLNTEKIYRTFAEILEKEDDLEFASVIVQKLNIILITSPELADFRRRLKSLETRQDGQALFTTLYRSWCHNAVSVFSLCLLAQAYEHASNLLYIFAELEITVPMLVQVDKLVQLIESPVFTYLRLQLLEPEKHPYLFKCLYGLLMLLPQSSAFVSLRNRLNAVNSAGFLQVSPKLHTGTVSGRTKIGRDEIKWQELLQHFRQVQGKHEKARRQASGVDPSPLSGFPEIEKTEVYNDKNTRPGGRVPMRRRVTGGDLGGTVSPAPTRSGVLSPLNPKARAPSGLTGLTPSLTPAAGVVTNNLNAAASLTQAQKARRPPDLLRK